MKLEDLTPGAAVCGILLGKLVPVVSVAWSRSDSEETTYATVGESAANLRPFQADEARLVLAKKRLPWSIGGLSTLLRLTLEALLV